ncbi:hypothetical protein ACFL43_05170 [Thermodesulfobacteriota bacterium]
MFIKKAYLKLLAEKPEVFGSIPSGILSDEAVAEMRQIPRLAIGEITGPAGFDGIFQVLADTRPDAFVPTLSYTGTEYGSWNLLAKDLQKFKKQVQRQLSIYVAGPIVLGAPEFWWALNACFSSTVFERFGFFGHCFGCRLYACALRIPLCKLLDARAVITGEMKLCGTAPVSDAMTTASKYYRSLLTSFGVELWHPELRAAAQHDPDENPEQGSSSGSCLRCVIEGNASAADAQSTAEPDALALFFESYAIPAAAKIISRTLAGGPVDYRREVCDTLQP